ncbi:MAG: hypothetical protein ACPL7B_12095, partial [Candidatus Poribacteria bacterium]
PITVTEKEMPPAKQPVEDFIDAILGRTKPLCSVEEGTKVVQAIESAYNSAKTGKQIKVSLS